VNRPQSVASADWGSWNTGNPALNSLGVVTAVSLQASDSDTLPGRSGVSSGTQASSHVVQSYTPGTWYREREARWNPSAANFATGIGLFYSQAAGTTSIRFASKVTPKIMKQDTQRLIVMERWTY